MNVIAIDMGYRNFAFIHVHSDDWRNPIAWCHEDLWYGRKGKPSTKQLLHMAHQWEVRNHLALQNADCIILETQLKKPFALMNTMIASRHWDRVVYMNPLTVGAFWKLPVRRAQKKPAGVARVKQFGIAFPNVKGKEDDLADAWLMAMKHLHEKGLIDFSLLKTIK